MNVTIRKAKPEDWETVQRLNHEVIEDNAQYEDALVVGWSFSDEGTAYFKKVTSSPEYCGLIAEVDGKLVGYLAGTEKKFPYRNIRVAEIGDMGVSSKYWSNGIGEKLVMEYRKWAKEHGFDRLYVNAYCKNEKAIAFYKKCVLNPIDISLEGPV